MKKLILILLCSAAFGQSYNQNIIPSSTGLNLGSSTQRWNFYVQNIDFSTIGTCTLAGTVIPCFPAGLLTANNIWTGTNTIAIGNFHLTGGALGNCVTTDGSGGLSFASCGAALNPTNLAIPVRSSGVFADSPITVSGSNITTAGSITVGNGSGTVDATKTGAVKGGTVGVEGATSGECDFAADATSTTVTQPCATITKTITGLTTNDFLLNSGSGHNLCLGTAGGGNNDWCIDGSGTFYFNTGSGLFQPKVFSSASECQLGGASGTTSPAACGSASTGMIAIPASQTSYTVNTTSVGTNSLIWIQQMTDNSGLPSSPTCNSGATTPIQSARVASTSFTFTLTSVASVTCVKYWIVDQ